MINENDKHIRPLCFSKGYVKKNTQEGFLKTLFRALFDVITPICF